jgi:hypothetical protein
LQDANKQPEISVDDIAKAPSSTVPTDTDVNVSIEQYEIAFSRVSEENAQLKQDLEKAEKKVKTNEILDGLLEPSAKKSFRYMFAYSGAVGILILLNGFGCFVHPLEAEVLKFLVGSTAATVIGLVGMVLTGIFVGARK